MRTLLIDNYDSFTYNLFQLLWEVSGTEPAAVRNDEVTWDELAERRFEAVVISPGPGRPERGRDFGVCAEAIRRCEAPLLGVCLGHQGIGWVHGGKVVSAPQPLHGRIDLVEHRGSSLFDGIPSGFAAVRYHSLCLARPLPACLEQIASSADGVPMAVAHRERPQWGVQFHPESVATEHGHRLLANFLGLAAPSRGSFFPRKAKKEPRDRTGTECGSFLAVGVQKEPRDGCGRLEVRELDVAPEPERVFEALYGESEAAFWLDSARPGELGRFSFMGDASGPLAAVVTYDVGAGEATIRRGGTGEDGRAEAEVVPGPLLGLLERERRRLAPAELPELPFGFDCGFAGYLGYELKAETGGGAAHRSPHPDAAFILADRLLAFDHERGHAYLLCLTPGGVGQAEDWLRATAARLEALAAAPAGTARCLVGAMTPTRHRSAHGSPEEPRLARSREHYLEDIEACREALLAGESYELCLTNRVEAEVGADPLDLYRRLRRANPAPFGAYLRFGGLAVLSSSPERFLAVDRAGRVEVRPIKGTSRRDPDPDEDARLAARLAADEKNRAENLMIADLLRNDLGRVCEPGSVEVPALMAVESYETVHQLVTTVRGRLRADRSALEAIGACFPPGSMTGAPKRRTTEILDRLEGSARGVYSGAIGYLGLGGACDLSVAIRTIVLAAGHATIGAGGAIVLQSEPDEEYEEMLLKAAAPLRALDPEPDPRAAFETVSPVPEG
jgi:para-aminobenzoate synthetase